MSKETTEEEEDMEGDEVCVCWWNLRVFFRIWCNAQGQL